MARRLEKRRCLGPADGSYEWKKLEKSRQLFAFSMRIDQPFAFAGLWDGGKHLADAQWLQTFAIITTTPNDLTMKVHDRMPVTLPRSLVAGLSVARRTRAVDLPSSRKSIDLVSQPFSPCALCQEPLFVLSEEMDVLFRVVWGIPDLNAHPSKKGWREYEPKMLNSA